MQPAQEQRMKQRIGNIKWLFGVLVVIGPLHMIEQMVFGIDEVYEMKRLVAVYHSWFSNPDLGTVVLVTVAGALCLLMMYGLIAGGRWQLAVIGFLGLSCIGEVHHVLRLFIFGHYNPGVVTCVPFATIGGLLLYHAYSQFRSTPRIEGQQATV
jgi:hypothetical protein